MGLVVLVKIAWDRGVLGFWGGGYRNSRSKMLVLVGFKVAPGSSGVGVV